MTNRKILKAILSGSSCAVAFATAAFAHSFDIPAGDLKGATNFEINDTPGNAFYDFIQYDIALFGTNQINQAAFDAAVANADNAVSGWTVTIPTITGLLLIGLIALGLWPRIAEYR